MRARIRNKVRYQQRRNEIVLDIHVIEEENDKWGDQTKRSKARRATARKFFPAITEQDKTGAFS